MVKLTNFEINQNEIQIIILKRIALFQAPLILTITKNGQTSVQVVDNFLFLIIKRLK